MQTLINQIDTRLRQGEFKKTPIIVASIIHIRDKIMNKEEISNEEYSFLKYNKFTF